MQSSDRASSRVQGVGCGLVLLVAAAICHPVAETGIVDDWSYVRTAQLLAQTGRIQYNGWATAMLGWQLFPAALCMRFFGSTFTVARVVTVLVAASTALVMQRCFARCGLQARNASLATLVVVLSPLFLPLATTYMSDIYGLLPIVACLYCCVRAVALDARLPGAWLVLGSVFGTVGGTARQIAWLGLLVMVPCAVWVLRRRRGLVALGAVCWVAGVGLIAASMRWFHAQAYAVPETFPDLRITGQVLTQLGVNYVRLGLELGLLLLPVLVAFLPRLGETRQRRMVALMGLGLCAVVAVVAHGSFHHLGQFLVPTLLDGGNYLSKEGVLTAWPELGARPTLLPDAGRALLTLIVIAGIAAVGVALKAESSVRPAATPESRASLPPKQLLLLTVPFTLSYLLLLAPRSTFFHPYDRYCLPLVFVAVLLLARLYQGSHARILPLSTTLLVAVVAAYSVCTTHDVFAMYRGTDEAIKEVTATGVPVTAVEAGWEFDGWSQVQQGGFVHDPRLRIPGEPNPASVDDSRPCPFELQYLFPDVHPLYSMAFRPGLCGGEAPFPPVTFHTWLPWRTQTIYVVRNGPRPQSQDAVNVR